MTKQVLKNIFKYCLGIGLLAYVVWLYWPGIKEALREPPNILPFLVALVILVPSVLLTFVRWYVLVRAQELPFTLYNAVRLGLVGYFYNMVLPGSVGGDIIKAAGIARSQSRRTVAVATVIIDRLIGVWGLCWLVALLGGTFWLLGNEAICTKESLQRIVTSAWCIVAGTLVIWCLLGLLPAYRAERFAGRLARIPKLGHSLAEIWRAIWMYRSKGKSIIVSLLLSLAAQVGFVVTYYLAGYTIHHPGPDIPPVPALAEHFLIIPIGLVVQGAIPLPGGMGAGELSFSLLYGLLNPLYEAKLRALGTLASLVQRMMNWILGFIGYLIYLRMRRSSPAATEGEVGGAGVAAKLETVNGQHNGASADPERKLSWVAEK